MAFYGSSLPNLRDQLTLNQRAAGSIPARPTNTINDLCPPLPIPIWSKNPNVLFSRLVAHVRGRSSRYPHLDPDRTVVRDLIPHVLIRLSIGHMTKRRPIHQCDRSLPKDDVVDELRELVVPATDGHIFCHGRQIRIWWIRIINVFPDVIPWLVEAIVVENN